MLRVPSLALWLAAVLVCDAQVLAAPSEETDRPAYDEKAALALSQAALGRSIPDYRFVDTRSQVIDLAGFRGRPLVVSLIYTSCYHICPMLTQHIAGVVEVAHDALGEDSFSVLTVGFDAANDTTDRMRIYAAERGIQLPGWHFASADAATIEALTQDLGFSFYASPKGFDHIAQTTVLDRDGRVYRQVYGQKFDTPALVEPLKQLVFGRHADSGGISGWLDGVKLFCTVYDPRTGRYIFDYSIFVSIFVGLMCLGAVAVFIIKAWRESRPSGPVRPG